MFYVCAIYYSQNTPQMKTITFLIALFLASYSYSQTDSIPAPKSDTDTTSTGWQFKFDVSDFKFRPKPGKFHGHWAGLELGFHGVLNADHNTNFTPEADFMAIEQTQSWVLSTNLLEFNFALKRPNIGLVTGAGIEWSRLSFQSDFTLVLQDDQTSSIPTDMDLYTNQLNMLFVNIPLILEMQFPANREHNFHLGVGVIGGLRVKSHQNQKWRTEGMKHENKQYGELNLNSFRYAATLRLGYSYVNLFANYSFTPLFQSGKGPEVYPFQVGIVLLNI